MGTRTFKDLSALIADLKGVKKNYQKAGKKALAKAGKTVQKDAKALFGAYQAGWPQLAEVTQEQRAKHGYAPDDPLLVTGGLRDAVAVKLEGETRTVFIGMEAGTMITGMDGKAHDAAMIMAVHEYGSTNGKVPARPVFGVIANRIDPILHQVEDAIFKELDL